jgi:molecular chaperone GrpE
MTGPDDVGHLDAERGPAAGDAPEPAVDAEPTVDAEAATDPEGAGEPEAAMRALAQRVQADFENYRKRVMRDQAELVERANDALVEQLLPVLDSFELALASLDPGDRARKGVELVYAELLGVLERTGLERIDADGQPFDPNVHEAVAHEEGDGEPVVVDTMRTGYRLKSRILRPAMVRVGPAPSAGGG